MNFNWETLNNLNNLIAYILMLVVFAFLDTVFIAKLSRKTAMLFVIPFQVLTAIAYPLGLNIFTTLCMILACLAMFLMVYLNLSDLRFLQNNNLFMKSGIVKPSKTAPEALFDREAMYSKINEAVLYFSRTKTGALITFERKDSLQAYINTGVKVNAPVSTEILQTIFYEGTRLHDGAVIIRNDQIVSAACLFQPSTRPVTGKMGLRHRAAMGISEVTDSVTVVVSEETGRISIAYGGDLETIEYDDFLEKFEEYMDLDAYVSSASK